MRFRWVALSGMAFEDIERTDFNVLSSQFRQTLWFEIAVLAD
jgi:urocanate hydratase